MNVCNSYIYTLRVVAAMQGADQQDGGSMPEPLPTFYT